MVEKETVATPSNEAEQTAPTNETSQVVQPEKTAEPVETVSQPAQTEVKEKVFTQAQLDEIVVNRLGKEKLRMLKKLGVESESQIESILEKSKTFDELQKERDLLKIEKEERSYKDVLNTLEVDPDFSEFALQKIDRGETLEAFTENAKKFLEANPKFKKQNLKEVNSSLDLGGREVYPDFEKMTTKQYLAWREKNKL